MESTTLANTRSSGVICSSLFSFSLLTFVSFVMFHVCLLLPHLPLPLLYLLRLFPLCRFSPNLASRVARLGHDTFRVHC